jgi:hypothetical protein
MEKRRDLIRKLTIALLVLTGAMGTAEFVHAQFVHAQADPPAGEEKVAQQTLIRISKETTVYTGPLKPDGYVDYIAATNMRRRVGVTKENNGAYDFVRIIDPDDQWHFHKELGIEKSDLPPSFVPWHDFVKEAVPEAPPEIVGNLLELRDELAEGPWKSGQAELVATWLQANKLQIDMLVKAAKKPRFYTPWSAEDQTVVVMHLPSVQEFRELSRTLLARAMLRLGEGDTAGAWSDLQAMHGLARQMGHGPTLIEQLVGVAIECVALNGDAIFIQSVSLAPEEIAKYQTQIQKLTTVSDMAESIDAGERIFFLDATQLVARDGVGWLARLTDGVPRKTNSLVDRLLKSSVDWNETLIVGNRWYDRCTKVVKIKSVPERRKEWKKLEQELQDAMPSAQGLQVAKLLFASKKTKGRSMANILLSMNIPVLDVATNAGSRADDQRQLTVVAFGLEAYREKHGLYPGDLNALVPRYIKSIPQDIFIEQPYKYETNGKDFRLFSVGSNFKYDGAVPGQDNVVTSKGWVLP